MSRILLLSPADLQLSLDQDGEGTFDADTQVVHRRVAYASCPPIGAHDWALADLAVLAAGQGAQDEGFDAVCLADFGDFGANALRSVLDIPVVTAGRASMLHALTLGSRFTVLATVRDRNRIGKLVHEYGLDHQCAGIIVMEQGQAMEPLLRQAEVLVMAPGTAGAAGETRVPTVDPLTLTVKLAESFLGLGLTHSRVAYPAPQVSKADLLTALAGDGFARGD
ncbi:aspartate/glutamate racemase family protein [Mesorhizobium sp. CAU 1741]|uniref:aspartate/glutamate racemase family protein n=1 Tax=Mesorhizobium sp. CAU 1741 TaxID=3140366 RepID=UPI00325BD0A9